MCAVNHLSREEEQEKEKKGWVYDHSSKLHVFSSNIKLYNAAVRTSPRDPKLHVWYGAKYLGTAVREKIKHAITLNGEINMIPPIFVYQSVYFSAILSASHASNWWHLYERVI